MSYLKHFNQALANRHKEMFIDGVRVSDEIFYRDSERHQTINDLIDIDTKDIEEFYDQTSVGTTRGQAE